MKNSNSQTISKAEAYLRENRVLEDVYAHGIAQDILDEYTEGKKKIPTLLGKPDTVKRTALFFKIIHDKWPFNKNDRLRWQEYKVFVKDMNMLCNYLKPKKGQQEHAIYDPFDIPEDEKAKLLFNHNLSLIPQSEVRMLADRLGDELFNEVIILGLDPDNY